jgi:hypothetical protein
MFYVKKNMPEWAIFLTPGTETRNAWDRTGSSKEVARVKGQKQPEEVRSSRDTRLQSCARLPSNQPKIRSGWNDRG